MPSRCLAGRENGKTRIRYHLETGLLIARGPSMELALIGQVIDRARDTANRRVTAINLHKNEASDLRLHLRQLESEMETEKIERDLARDELRVAESHLADVQKLAEEEFVSNAQLAGTQLEIDKKRANIRKHELKIDTLLARISAARERLETLTGRE